MRRPPRRKLRAAGFALLAAAGAAAAAFARSTEWLASFGGRVAGDRLDRARRSGHWADGRFVNTLPTSTIRSHDIPATLRLQFTGDAVRYPQRPIPVAPRARADYDTPPVSGLRVTWMGHAGALIEIDGVRVLTDPVWSDRVSPSSIVGPKRFFAPPIALADLPPLDAVAISHDHYDHLDMATVVALARRGTLFLVPLGVGAHFEEWGVPAAQVRELDWDEAAAVGGATLTATPARHFSGRGVTDRDATLWCSWVIAGPRHRVFYSGDSGYFGGFRDIGAAHGPFDATLMSLGSYGPTWPEVHMDPEETRPGAPGSRRRPAPSDSLGNVQSRVPRLERAGRAGNRGGAPRGRADRAAAPGRDGGAVGRRRTARGVVARAVKLRAPGARISVGGGT